MSKILYIDDNKLEQLFTSETGEVVIVDIRNPGEHSVEYIDGSVNLPLDELLTANKNQFKDKVILFHCKGGVRTRANQHLLEAFASKESFCLEGGIDQWKSCGKPVKQPLYNQ